MTNEEARLEVIKKAYGNTYEYFSRYMDEFGFVRYDHQEPIDSMDIIDTSYYKLMGGVNVKIYAWAPEALENIENNNGWTRIEQDHSNMPTKEGWYWTIDDNDQIEKIIWYNNGITEKIWKEYGKTHYMKMFELPKPTY